MGRLTKLSADSQAFECGNCKQKLVSCTRLLKVGDPRVVPASALSGSPRKISTATNQEPTTVFRTRQSFLVSVLPRSFDVVLVDVFDQAEFVSDDVGPPPTTDFTWFEGRAHRILVCTKCRNHIGWSYEADGDKFFGLAVGVSKFYAWCLLSVMIGICVCQISVGGGSVYLTTAALGIALVKLLPYVVG